MGRLYISLLGPLEANLDGASVDGLGSQRVRALLAYLAAEQERPHTRQALAALLWPEAAEESARSSLRSALSRLRRAIGDPDDGPPVLLVTRETIQFNPACDHWLDTEAWDARSPDEMEAALGLVRGEFLEGLAVSKAAPFEEWLSTLRDRWRRALLARLHELAEHHAAQRDHSRALTLARRLVEAEPWQEEGQRLLMRILAESGQRSAALAQYEVCRDALRQELGVAPARETTALYEAIRGESVGPGRSRGHSLPSPLFPLIGRVAELAEIASLLSRDGPRLLTLVGPGGCGKTHLALEAASRMAPGFGDGACFVSAAPLGAVGEIVYASAAALGYSFEKGGDEQQVRAQLLEHLRGKRLLLILDNLEHLPEAGDLAQEMVREAPGLALLATSRARLNVPAEQVLVLEGLPCPSPEPGQDLGACDSVQLFLEGARRANSSF